MDKDKKIYIDRLFPKVNEMNLNYKLKINQESIMYITIPDDAEQITKIIINHYLKSFPDYHQLYITDATAGVGGNTISFAQKFKQVNAIEIDPERFNYLSNNINAYQISNVNLYNDNCIDIIPKLDHNDVIFIDPPWGGKKYKSHEKIKLTISDKEIEVICLQFLDSDIMLSLPKLIVLKLPKNYDIEYVYHKIKQKDINIYLYQLNKMNIIVIERINSNLVYN